MIERIYYRANFYKTKLIKCEFTIFKQMFKAAAGAGGGERGSCNLNEFGPREPDSSERIYCRENWPSINNQSGC